MPWGGLKDLYSLSGLSGGFGYLEAMRATSRLFNLVRGSPGRSNFLPTWLVVSVELPNSALIVEGGKDGELPLRMIAGLSLLFSLHSTAR